MTPAPPGAAGHEHAGTAADPAAVDEVFHAHGLRVTSQRRRVVAALGAGAHLTPDQVAAAVAADGGDALPASTVYRTLDTLEDLGVVTHTHLTHGAPTYHLTGHSGHVHLVCRVCGEVQAVPAHLADGLVAALRDALGFAADIEHMGIHGRCARCLAADGDDPPGAADGEAGDAPGTGAGGPTTHDHGTPQEDR